MTIGVYHILLNVPIFILPPRSNMIANRSIAPGFKPRPGYVSRVFQLWLRLITFGDRSAHLTCLKNKSGRKTATFFINKIPFYDYHISLCLSEDIWFQIYVMNYIWTSSVNNMANSHFTYQLIYINPVCNPTRLRCLCCYDKITITIV
jgi:hypothetical protein